MHNYQKAFGEEFNIGFGLEHFPFLNDTSYRNDDCPSFAFKVGKKIL